MFAANIVRVIEIAGDLATAIGFPVAAVGLYVENRRNRRARQLEEQLRREDADQVAFQRAGDGYREFLKIVCLYPKLNLGDRPLVNPPKLTEAELVQQDALWNIWISLVEAAYLMYALSSDETRKTSWTGWEKYVLENLRRTEFRALWYRHKNQYHAEFVAHLDKIESDDRRTRHRDLHLSVIGPLRDGMQEFTMAIEFLVKCGKDCEGYGNSYIPRDATVETAQAWIERDTLCTYLVRAENHPIGLLSLHSPRKSVQSLGDAETSTYLMPEFRGYGVANRAWAMVEPEIATRFPRLVASVWESNHSAARRLSKAGWHRWGTEWYETQFYHGADESGMCTVWTRTL